MLVPCAQSYADVVAIIKSLPNVKGVRVRVKAQLFGLQYASECNQATFVRPAGQLGPLEARQLPGLFAYARYTGSARCFCARMCCLSEFTTPLVVWLVVESVCRRAPARIGFWLRSDMP